ncbi:Succinate-semialdehyde dehydrogenase [Lasiodiplodia theobromae]|uniref:Succinate-semialdehyde dehydrogenase n=1 Tax=Lasiodiplodia theobromae TaxID=45133 RepID=UPI0015C3CC5F|nr:Succinate-semialdehyde dehydrogenase [Lasiodiplodia theobromae]KAF4536057.1 Succinate-semialdehyde dehydrogenase [Lasiodiplodia theobromae]
MQSDNMKRDDPITVDEAMQIAKTRLPKNIWEFYVCGSDDGNAVKRNSEAFDRLFILPRVMRNVTSVDTSTTLFGTKYPLPIGIAPSAMQKLVGGNGEVDMARAAASLGMNLTLSSQSTTSLEEVMQERNCMDNHPPFWMQIYMTQDLEKSIPLIKRAEAAGYEALVVTVDTPVLGNRINERKTPLVLPENLRLANIESPANAPKLRKPTFNRLLMDARTAQQAQDIISSAGGSMHSASLEWTSTINFLRKTTSMKVILKGIMTPEDAALAVKHGADFVLVGRAVLWGLAFDGQRGVETIGHILERELSRAMALAGIVNLKEADRRMLAVAKQEGFGMARL